MSSPYGTMAVIAWLFCSAAVLITYLMRNQTTKQAQPYVTCIGMTIGGTAALCTVLAVNAG